MLWPGTAQRRAHRAVLLGDIEVRLRASVGVATGRDDPASLLHEADMAMYAVKNAARSTGR